MNTQIFGTFGPACEKKETLKKMIEAGLTGMRLNLSHTTLPESVNYIETYKHAAQETGVSTQILIDMQGPELRVGDLRESVFLSNDEIVSLGITQTEALIPIPQQVVCELKAGDELLLDDGKILLSILSREEGIVEGKVIRGGELKARKSIKIKDKYIKLPPLTEHDIENIKLAKEYGVTALMQPFVLRGDDLKKVRQQLKTYGAEGIQIFAKIENRIGVEHIEEILQEADVIVIARGDLGNDMPLWELPGVQKQIEVACKNAKKPYVVVTQMLASMEHNPTPTRAEVSDIYHAVYHGAWGVMVTGETAIGEYPIEVIRYLSNTSKEAERK